ncbi:APC family permease [Saccharopolyspora tripterygii]
MSASSTDPSHALGRDQLGTAGVTFLVLAAVAPLTAAVVVASLAIGLGSGGGTVVAYVAVAVVLLLFAVGYAQMSREVVNAGGFYAFVVRGLGRPAGLVAGFLATTGYNVFVAGAVGTGGFYTSSILEQLTGVHLHWYACALVIMGSAFLLARSGISISATALGIALVLEVLVLLAFSAAVLVRTGFSVEAFGPAAITGGAPAIGLLLASTAFLGFEATSLFSEEAKNPARTVPRATYLAIVLIGLIHGVTVWAVVSAVGVADAQRVAESHLADGDLLFVLIGEHLGGFLLGVAMVLLVVSLVAAQLAFHNVAGRYLFALGRARILPGALARTRESGVPQRALSVNAAFAVVVAAPFAVLDLDVITSLVPVMVGFGTLCIIVLQALAALSIVVHFRRSADPRLWSTLVAPGLGFLGLAGISAMAVGNFGLLAGSDAPHVTALPWLLPVVVIAGLAHAAHLRARRPEVYANLGADLERFGGTRSASAA